MRKMGRLQGAILLRGLCRAAKGRRVRAASKAELWLRGRGRQVFGSVAG